MSQGARGRPDWSWLRCCGSAGKSRDSQEDHIGCWRVPDGRTLFSRFTMARRSARGCWPELLAGRVCARKTSEKKADKSLHTNRRHPSPLVIGWQLRCAFHAQRSSPAVVGELLRSPMMQAERAKLKSRRDDMIVAQIAGCRKPNRSLSLRQRINHLNSGRLKMTFVVSGDGVPVEQGGCCNQGVFTSHCAVFDLQISEQFLPLN